PLLGLLLLYVGQCAVSALLFELVEEPARLWLLRRARRTTSPEPAAPSGRAWRAVAASALVIAVPCAILAAAPLTAGRGPATLALRLGGAPDDLVIVRARALLRVRLALRRLSPRD